jgi:hypothetical protein
MTVGRMGSPCCLGGDHSLGQDTKEAPEPLRAARRGVRGPLSSHLGLFMVCLIFEETVRWVRGSAPAGCSPRGLGGMGDPFKGL